MAQQTQIGRVSTTRGMREGLYTVTYHSTDVVKFNNNIIKLNTGGWYSATTKTRMNQTSNEFGLGYKVFQKNNEWFVTFKGETIPFTDDMELVR